MGKVNCIQCGVANPAASKYCSQCGYELPLEKTETTINPIPSTKALNSDSKKQQTVLLVFGMIASLVCFFLMRELFFDSPSFDKEMVKVANEINKNCPITVDKETRLDNVEALPENVFRYNYTLVNLEKSQIDSSGMKEYLESKITSDVQTNPDLKQFREHKTTMEYSYKDKNGIPVMTIRAETVEDMN